MDEEGEGLRRWRGGGGRVIGEEIVWLDCGCLPRFSPLAERGGDD